MSASVPPQSPAPKAGPGDQQDRRKSALLLVACALLGALLVWTTFFRSEDSTADPKADPTPSVSVTAVGPGGVPGGGEASGRPSTAPTESTPRPTFGNTPAPNPTATYTGTDANEDLPTEPAPGFTASSDRKAESGDVAKAKELLGRVIPAWSNNDTSKGNNIDIWGPQWQGNKGVAASFLSQSRMQYLPLWGGIGRMDVSALNAKIVSQEPLWNIGSHSLWKVTVERDLKSNRGQVGMDNSEQVVWDILVKQDGKDFEVANFAYPKPENKKPETFYVPEGTG